MTSERGDARLASAGEDEPVLAYLAALEARRAAPDTLPKPDASAAALANAETVAGDDVTGLEAELGGSVPGSEANLRRLEDDFVGAAAAYSRRHGTTYAAWRQAGVDPEVLARAGIAPEESS